MAITRYSSPQEDLDTLKTLREGAATASGLGGFSQVRAHRRPGGDDYRQALDQVIEKYGSVEEFQAQLEGGPKPVLESIPAPDTSEAPGLYGLDIGLPGFRLNPGALFGAESPAETERGLAPPAQPFPGAVPPSLPPRVRYGEPRGGSFSFPDFLGSTLERLRSIPPTQRARGSTPRAAPSPEEGEEERGAPAGIQAVIPREEGEEEISSRALPLPGFKPARQVAAEPQAPIPPTPGFKPGQGSAPEPEGEEEPYQANPWLPLAAAGFGMASSKSPFFGVAAGQGGLAGLKMYAAEQERAREAQQQALENELAQRKVQLAETEAASKAEAREVKSDYLKALADKARRDKSSLEGLPSNVQEYIFLLGTGLSDKEAMDRAFGGGASLKEKLLVKIASDPTLDLLIPQKENETKSEAMLRFLKERVGMIDRLVGQEQQAPKAEPNESDPLGILGP